MSGCPKKMVERVEWVSGVDFEWILSRFLGKFERLKKIFFAFHAPYNAVKKGSRGRVFLNDFILIFLVNLQLYSRKH